MASYGNVSLGTALEDEIERARHLNNQTARGGFVSIGFIHSLLTIENIKKQLKEVPDTRGYLGAKRTTELAHLIKEQGSKLYTILILLGKSDRIRSLMVAGKPPINDSLLFRSPGRGHASLPCSLEDLQGIPELSDIANEFYKKQWIVPPSLLSDETRVFDAQHFRFPFASSPRRLGRGSYGEVFAVELPKGYLEPLENTSNESSQNTCIAYKRIQRKFMKEEQWQKAKREVYVLRERRGEYITPLLGSFLAGMHDTSSGKECLYLLSPQAKYDMESWMQNPPDEWIGHTEDRLRQHIYRETIPGLISGLTWIHREINHRVGYHRDIKPSNILLFEKGAQELVWKICDFGSSNLKEANDTATTNLITSWKWAPPEFFTDDDTNDGEKHGRTHDVYSMGCVFLCLATMLRFGWRSEGLEQFEKDRINIKDDRENVRDSSDEASFHKSEKAIHKWIVYLQEIRRQDEDKEVLALIEEMLQPRNKRIFSWEVEIDLFIILDKRGHPEEIAERLSKIIQKSRGTNLQTHNPYVRAKEKARLEKGTVKKRSPEFFRILAKGRWQEYVPQSTTDGLPSVASVQSPLSNFPPSKHRTGGIYGGQGLYTSISAGFRHSDIVVLYGMAGVGKSCNAEEYALQFSIPKDTIHTKHTFTVNARSIEDLRDSFRGIAERINMPVSGTRKQKKVGFEVTTNTVKTWFEDETNEGWFMLVDGLDSYQDAKEIKEMLPMPRRGYDQMLITTRNRHVVVQLDLYHKGACIEVNSLDLDDSHRLFSNQIDSSLITQDPQKAEGSSLMQMDPDTYRLLSTLWSPLLIKYAAIYMNRNQNTVAEMNSLLGDLGLTQIQRFFPDQIRRIYPDYLAYILAPLTSNLHNTASWSREVRLLFLLAFFDRKGVNQDILKLAYEGPEREMLQDLSSRLKDCSLIDRKEQRRGSMTYVIKGNIQIAVLEWIKNFKGKTGGPGGLFLRYNKALSTICRYYRSKNTTKDGPLKLHKEKLALMRHFECFLAFTKEHPQRSKLALDREAVQAITYFSYVLLDQDRHMEAIHVIKYAQQHFLFNYKRGGILDKERLKQMRVRFWLGRQLVKVYMSRPEDHDSYSYWSEAQQLLESLKTEARQINEEVPKWDGYMIVWHLALESARVLRKEKRYAEARQSLGRISNITGMLISDVGIVYEPRPEREIKEWLETRPGETLKEKETRSAEFRRLLIHLTREHGMLNVAEGMALGNAQKTTTSCYWAAAKEQFRLAETAVYQWFPRDMELRSKIRVDIAVVDTKVGQHNLLEKAIHVLDVCVAELRSTYGECSRTWDLERKLNAARLKSDKRSHVKVATECSAKILHKYEERDWRDKVATKECAEQYNEGLLRLGRVLEAQELREQYPELPPLSDSMAFTWILTCMLVAGPVFAGCLYYTFRSQV